MIYEATLFILRAFVMTVYILAATNVAIGNRKQGDITKDGHYHWTIER